jgi:hypothetical protein
VQVIRREWENGTGVSAMGSVLLGAVVWLALLTSGTEAQAGDASGYAGFGLGNAACNVDRGHAEFGGSDMSPTETAWRVFGGGRYKANLGLEVGYIKFGEARVSEQALDRYFQTGMAGFEVTPVGFLPVGKGFSTYARAGLIFWTSDLTYGTGATVDSTSSESGSSLSLGVGAEYTVGRYLGFRAEYTRYLIDKEKAGSGDAYNISVGGYLAIGRK